MKHLRWLILLPLLCGCQLQMVNVDTYFVGPESLASYWVGTPDPKRCCPDVGQELVLSWHIPERHLSCEDLHICWTIRYGNHEEQVFHIPVHTKIGERRHLLINQDYWDRGGIQTYKVEVIANGEIIKTLCNSVWSNIIDVCCDDGDSDADPAIEWVE